MDLELCEICELPGKHPEAVCLVELRHKLKQANDMFNAAITLIHALGDPVKIGDETIAQKVVELDVATWRFAM